MAFKSIKELENYIKKAQIRTVNQAQNKAYEIINKTVDEFYNEFKPHSYDRTYQLRSNLYYSDIDNSTMYYGKGLNGYRAEVGYDERMFNYDYDKYQVLRWAMVGDRPHGNYEIGTAIWNESNPILKNELPNYIKSQLKANGLPIK